jgi:hypothetical protein
VVGKRFGYLAASYLHLHGGCDDGGGGCGGGDLNRRPFKYKVKKGIEREKGAYMRG